MTDNSFANHHGASPGVRATAIPEGNYRHAPKRAFDLVVGLALIPVIATVVAILYLVVRLDGGPGFFGHERVGRDGKKFRCWKIRTMAPDAEARLKHILASDPRARAEWERDHKLEKDPRITRFGRFLRKSSLDELPQIWNVIKGEMSLIGPRPVTAPEVERYGGYRWVYFAMRPGVTGLWQVSGRNDVSYDERVNLDIEYFEHLSLTLDFWIILRTISAVVSRTGR